MTKLPKWQKLQKKLKIKFKNEKLLIRAFTHPSFFKPEKCQASKHYERLEFLGDSILEYIITNLLYTKCSKSSEGKLTKLRGTLVSRHILLKVFNKLEITEFIRFKPENTNRFASPEITDSIKADILEALIGAIFLDRGIKTAEKFIEQHIFILLKSIRRKDVYFHPINKLQELLAQKDNRARTPHYQIIKKGKAHKPYFQVHLFFKGTLISKSLGNSKKEASKEAARIALKKLAK